ncbi:MAG: hypothetical protein CL609_12155 [Anaerolineaceae bacterium]|nr:hypothetical protein [Anaerolineaceae bacterium]
MKNEQRYNDLVNLLEISRDLASTLDLNSLLNKIVQVAANITEAEAASILLYDHKKNELKFKAATNQEIDPKITEMVVPKDSIAGWAAQHQSSLFVPDVHKDPRFFDQVEKALDFPTRSIIAIPMITKGRLIGILEVLNKKHDSFTQYDLELLETLGAQAAVAIENSHLFEQSDAIADLVHELRTPLSSIKTITYLLNKPEIIPEDRQKLIDTIQNETNRLNYMVTNFLDLVRMETGRLSFEYSTFDFNSLVNECMLILLPLATQHKIKIIDQPESEQLIINADRSKIKQVILNLLNNAIKYNHPDGTITLQHEIKKDKLTFSITDSGVGIPEKEIPFIFNKFYRASSVENEIQGTGLGLSISRQIIENHQGSIGVKSQKDKGSTFFFELPIKKN